MNRKTTVTHIDGTVSTRTSKTMVYTWAVEVGPADPEMMAAQAEAAAIAADETAVELRIAAANPTITIRDRGLGRTGDNDFLSHVVTLVGTSVTHWANAKGEVQVGYGENETIMSARDALVASALNNADSYEQQAAAHLAKADDYRTIGVPANGWSVYRWSTRADLAGKGAQEASTAFAGQGRTIRIRPVD